MSVDYTNPTQNRPPRDPAISPEDQVFSGTTGIAAASFDLWSGYPADAGGLKTPQGKVWIELEVTASTAYVRFTKTATTATTVASGAGVVVGTPRRFYVDPTKDLFMDVIAAGAGTIKWRRCGAIMERSRT